MIHSNQHDAPRTLVSRLWTATVLSGVVTAILGILVLVWPGKSLIVVSALFGAYLLISGIAQVIFAFTLHVSAGGRFLLFISGGASLILAVLAFRHFGRGSQFSCWPYGSLSGSSSAASPQRQRRSVIPAIPDEGGRSSSASSL